MVSRSRAGGGLIALLVAQAGGCGAPTGAAPRRGELRDGSTATAPASASPVGAASARASAPFRSGERFDLILRGGRVVDGTGRPAVRADVVVRGDRIVFVGDVDANVAATTVVDVTGRVVAPGFIDMHSHADPLAPNENALAMGVTTVTIGQDGRSPSDGPIAAWADRVERAHPYLDIVPLVGHGTVRNLAGVGLKSDPSRSDLEAMQRLVAQAMAEGAFGLSTGLEYLPGRKAHTDELVAIAKPVAEHGGVVMSHLRSEDDDAIDGALDELIAQGRGAGARVHVAHLKVVYGHGSARAEALLRKLDDARRQGVAITADAYPYAASFTGIDIVFPDWAKAPHDYKTVLATRRQELRAYLRDRVARRNGPKATLFETAPWGGKTLEQVARERHKPFEDVLIDDIGPTGASAIFFVMDEALEDRLLFDPFVSVGTDGSATSGHPRAYGAFARVLRDLVHDKHALSLEEAIRKMTALPASVLGLADRGVVAAGATADLVVLDPDHIRDLATFDHPARLAEGVDVVVIGGVIVRQDGKLTGARPGHVLRKLAPSHSR